MSLSIADYAVLAFYFVFMISMGWVFKRFIRDTSDYFRSGGEMLWWIYWRDVPSTVSWVVPFVRAPALR